MPALDRAALSGFTTPESAQMCLQNLRASTLHAILRIATVFGALAILAGLLQTQYRQHWVSIAIHCVAILSFFILAYSESFTYRVRAFAFVAILFAFAWSRLLSYGFVSLAPMLLLACVAIAALLGGYRIGLVMLGAVIVSIAVLAAAEQSGMLVYAYVASDIPSPMSALLPRASILIVLGLSIVLSINRLLRELVTALASRDELIAAMRHEIHVREEAETARLDAEQRFRSIIEACPMGIHMYTLNDANQLIFQGANLAADEILGIQCGAHIGKPIEDAFPALASSEIPARYREIARGSDALHIEHVGYHDDAVSGAYSVHAFSIGPNQVAAMFFDITEEKRNVTALRAREQHFRSLIENVGDVVMECTPDGTMRYLSPASERMMGYRPDEHIGRNAMDYVHPDDRPTIATALGSALANRGVPHVAQARLRHADGTWRIVEVIGTAIVNPSGDLCVIVNYRDISSKVKADEERLRLESQLAQAKKMEAVGQLAGGVAHDFNNVLTAIYAYSDIALTEPAGSDKQRAHVEEIRKAAHRAGTLVRQLLVFSRREALQLVHLNINATINDLNKMLVRLLGEHIDLNFQPGDNLWAALMDAGQFEQLIINLAVNGRDAMSTGGRLSISTENRHLDNYFCADHTWAREGEFIRVRVSDTGAGIPPEIMDRIFEPFFTTKANGHGTGLGLATVYGVVDRHNGLIDVRSTLGRGTTFDIYLPKTNGVSEQAAAAAEEPPAADGADRTILVAEDDPSVRSMICRVLESGGYRVVQARDGNEAWNQYQKESARIALCILDVVMPGQTGPMVRDRIFQCDPNMRILHITGHDFDMLRASPPAERIVRLLPKPFTVHQLLREVANVLEESAITV